MIDMWNRFKKQFPNADLSKFTTKDWFDDKYNLSFIIQTMEPKKMVLLIVIKFTKVCRRDEASIRFN